MTVELLPVTAALLEASSREGWLEDSETNREMGFGSDDLGTEAAVRSFLDACDNGCLGIYFNSRPAGWVLVEKDGDASARLSVYVAPRSRRKGVGKEAVKIATRALLASGCRRVGVQVPEINKPARAFFRACGFRREGKTWLALLIDEVPYDTENLVLTQTEPKRRVEATTE